MSRGSVFVYPVTFQCFGETFSNDPCQNRTYDIIARIFPDYIYVVKEAANSIGGKDVIDAPITETTASIILARSCFVTMV